MSQAFLANYVHIVFSTKQRLRMIQGERQKRMWAYLGGIAKHKGMIPMAINGGEDHVHALVALPSNIDVAKAVNALKANSSQWAKTEVPNFQWQRGYAAFSVSTSNLRHVTAYIENQAEHHKRRDYKEEFLALLRKHNVKFDPETAFD